MISLFEPAYPCENALKSILNSKEARQRKNYDTPSDTGYWIHPDKAPQLLTTIKCLESHR